MSASNGFHSVCNTARWLAIVGLLLMSGAGRISAQQLFNQRSVGGITVDAQGVVRQSVPDEQLTAVRQLRKDAGKVPADLQPNGELRKVSLRALEAVLRQTLADNPARLPDELQYLGGLQRIQYVLVYPEQKDIVLAGPGEGWTIGEHGEVVGVTTGLPVLRLEDLLVALRTVEAARTEGLSVSIDPTPEGRSSFKSYVANMKRRGQEVNREAVAGLAEAMGPQLVTFTGVPTDSHFARVLVAGDYRMKRLAMDLDPAPIPGLPGFLELLKAKNRLPGNAMPRWWLACNYEPLARSEDRLVWQLRGPGVKAMTEDEWVDRANGQVQGTGKTDPIAKAWADRLTEKYEELAKQDLIFTEVRNLMDMSVVAALIAHEDLLGLAGCDLSLLTASQSPVAVSKGASPKHISTQCSFLKIGRNYVITASGGVQITSWEVAENTVIDANVKATHDKGVPPTGKTWCWN